MCKSIDTLYRCSATRALFVSGLLNMSLSFQDAFLGFNKTLLIKIALK